MLLDKYSPKFDFTEDYTAEVKAPPDAVYRAMMEFTSEEMPPFVKALSFLRTFPEKMAGRKMTDDDIHAPYLPQGCRDFFTELANQPPKEYVFGLIVPGDIGRVWKKSSELDYRPKDGTEFLAFDNPSYVKVAMSVFLSGGGKPGFTNVLAEWRIRAQSPEAKKRFTPYWRVIGPFSHYIQKCMVKAIKKRAEKVILTGVPYAAG